MLDVVKPLTEVVRTSSSGSTLMTTIVALGDTVREGLGRPLIGFRDVEADSPRTSVSSPETPDRRRFAS